MELFIYQIMRDLQDNLKKILLTDQESFINMIILKLKVFGSIINLLDEYCNKLILINKYKIKIIIFNIYFKNVYILSILIKNL